MQSGKKAIIVGCGIAGPAVAMFLQRAGIEAAIYEAVDTPNDYAGAFLNLMPNGIDVLNTLGLVDEVHREGHTTERFVFTNSDGRRICEMDLTGSHVHDGMASFLIRRGALSQVLREAAARRGVALHFGKRLADFEDADGSVIARFEDGTAAEGDLLVGCDGVHSRTRSILLPAFGGPSYVGLLSIGAISQMPSLSPTASMTMTFGKRAFFGYQAVPSGEVYWFSNIGAEEPDRADLAALSGDDWKQRLLELHRHDPAPISAIIEATEGPIGGWPIYDLPSLPSWCRGAVCLVGDAAHAVSPSAGQGASLALEDAIVLAKCLRDISDTRNALARYEVLRKDRAEKVVLQGRRNGNNKVVTNPVTRWLRDRLMPFFAKLGERATAEIAAYRVRWETRVA